MKRHEALIPLSRFHRSCLFLALVAKENAPVVKGYPTDIEGKITYALSFYSGPLKRHFIQEEKLWDYVKSKSENILKVVCELQEERKKLQELFQALEQKKLATDLHEIGELLERHVRKEERALFQQIQQDLTEEELSAIPDSIS